MTKSLNRIEVRGSMDLTMIESQYEQLNALIKQLANYGPFAGIILTMIESLFPPLPLVVFVTINVIAYGLWWGYLYSFLGTFIGSYIMFLLISKYGKRRFEKMVHRSSRFDHLIHWIKEKGFVPIFVMLTFPFTPSIVVCGLAGLAGVKRDEYVAALFFGKLIMVFSLSYIGYNVASFLQQPIKSVALILLIVAISLLGKRMISLYEKRLSDHHHKKLQNNDK